MNSTEAGKEIVKLERRFMNLLAKFNIDSPLQMQEVICNVWTSNCWNCKNKSGFSTAAPELESYLKHKSFHSFLSKRI
jgi:DNA polymerase I-like protein with 3'-5' exonuclease and polymerase domains